MSFITNFITRFMEDRVERAKKNHQMIADVERIRKNKLDRSMWDKPNYYARGLGDVPTEAEDQGLSMDPPAKGDWKARFF
mmetsp:Transcript_18252/g.44819  ORF Transcript_18252/g.44819 Transcript_18252/m.44819 type:complete len:80 (-) Transcript_18252:282-521(-)|eukprot:CAMPEP_0114516354 /NCGR_PEP_ID=MMETSP0109-20121206/17280_1 /TAXON_ID=29199 /ORGANISM="Chlorarachnion reptans, Strain CCCM449" /LENGTH=79 /DNA_ID=CAMNT_0001696731 /DNA_START=181 /DNA_END=420 /DNA_ORIENTATION=+